MRDEFPFLKAIANRPEDDLLRLVYADWLDDRGDPRGEYVRLDAELHRRERPAVDAQNAMTKWFHDHQSDRDRPWLEWLRRTRNLNRTDRLDLAVVSGGAGRIEVRGREREAALFVDGRPVASGWDAARGSVGRHLLLDGHPDGAARAGRLAAFAEQGVGEAHLLGEHLGPLLAAFPSGTYYLEYDDEAPYENVPAFSMEKIRRTWLCYSTDSDRHLIYARADAPLDERRVDLFREQIRDRRRPVVLVTTVERTQLDFVIDGRHKLAAYERENRWPAVLGIVPWEGPEAAGTGG